MRFLRLLYASIRDFFRDGGIMHSASLSFFFIMAIVPLCLLMISVFVYVLGKNVELYQFFMEKVIGIFPESAQGITRELTKVITFQGMGRVSFLIYAVISFQLYASLNSAINAIFKIKKDRNIFITVLLSFLVVSITLSFILASFVLSSAIELFEKYVSWFSIHAATTFLIKTVLPFFLLLSVLTILYKILPRKKISWANAFAGGVFTAVMLGVAKYAFTWYVTSAVKLGTIYGSLSSFIVFMLWVYYSSIIFLIGGEMVNNLEGGQHLPRSKTRG